MPPNPRDNLTPGRLVPRERVEHAIANALYGPENHGDPRGRLAKAAKVVDRLLHFRLLAADVEGMERDGPGHFRLTPEAERTTYDDQTLHKVYRALARAGLSHAQASDAVTEMQNEGILFRERA